MKCSNCGKELNDGELFCSNCGTKVAPTNNSNVNPSGEMNPVVKIILEFVGVWALFVIASFF